MTLKPEELRIDIFRPPRIGDHTFKRSGVRITHIPTGTVVTALAQGNSIRNKELALKHLERLLRDEASKGRKWTVIESSKPPVLNEES